MREKRTFAERTKVLPSSETNKKYFLVYEGAETELIYFDVVNNLKNEIGINPLIELIPLVRSYSEVGWSNPKKLLDRVMENIEENKTGAISYETLLNWIMDYLYEEKVVSTSKVQSANIWKTLAWICEEKIHVNLNSNVVDLEDACNGIITLLSEESDIDNMVDDIPKIIKSGSITYAEGFDKICFIVDRDRKSFVARPDNNQYEYVLRKCRENYFGFYLTNPCFEFWLLLHFEDVTELDKGKLLENPKANTKRRYTEQELRRIFPGYAKAKYNAETLVRNIDKAIENEKLFCEDEELLEHTVGSNVGLLIEEMRR